MPTLFSVLEVACQNECRLKRLLAGYLVSRNSVSGFAVFGGAFRLGFPAGAYRPGLFCSVRTVCV
jgi:hypothetical protein